VQEAQDKWPAIRARHPDVRLHMIGQLQSNKAAEAAALFDVIHSLDRPSLLDALAAAPDPKPAFVQVNLGEEEQKGGVAPGELPPSSPRCAPRRSARRADGDPAAKSRAGAVLRLSQ
jgi:uncharacterized pyridoxal phosphate-containing UPF0001 family protein